MKKILNPFKEAVTLFKALRFFYDKVPNQGSVDDFEKLAPQIELLKNFHSAGTHFFYVADLRKMRIVDAGGSLNSMVGVSKEDVINRNFAYGLKFFSLKELPSLMKSLLHYHEYVYQKPVEDRLKIKGTIIVKVKTKKGHCFTGLLQAAPLMLDSNGNIAFMYSSITDVSHFNIAGGTFKCDIIDESDPEEVKFINVENKIFDVTLELSKSELKVLKHLAEGLSAKEVADRLFLSEHTVRTHRKNMIQKAKVKNTVELLSVASKLLQLVN